MIKAEYVNPFYMATIEVFKLMLDLDIQRGLPGQQQLAQDKRVNIVIEIVGDLKGAIYYHFPEEMILEMVRIMSGMEFNEVDGFVTSALGEVSNIISGNAVTKLFANNYKCDILPPKILYGDQTEAIHKAGQVLRIPMQTPIGDLHIDIALAES